MKAKYFSAESREKAEEMAAAYFSCDKSALAYEVESGEEGSASWLVLAMSGTTEELKNSDAGYALCYEDSGVYLELYAERGSGKELDVSELSRHINRKNLTGISTTVIQAITALRRGRSKIAPPQQEFVYGEDVAVTISGDEMEAVAILLKPEPGGAQLAYDAFEQKIRNAGVTSGLNEQALKYLLENKDYERPRVIAKAVMPVDGEAGKLVFHFSRDERTGSPREIGGGRVDLRSLDLFEPVSEGQLLVEKIPATEGVPGEKVTGAQIKQKPGKDVNLPRGKNVDINDEKTEMRAKFSGMVELINNSVNVSSVYSINGDCDVSTGNIDFDGSVNISGSVRSGYTVKASGGIVVGGMVEAATLIAGGNVEVKGGMQGGDKGRIEAGGSITMMYIERGTAIAEKSITFDASIHSTLEAGGSIKAEGKRGAIIGGRAGAAGNVTASVIGAASHANTEIEVGMTPKKRARIQYLEENIEKLKGELVKLDQLDAYLGNSKGKMDPETWKKLFISGTENRKANEQAMGEYSGEADALKTELSHATDSKVHVFDTTYYGAKIIIGNGIFKVTNEIQYATFKYKDSEVMYVPCELSRQKG